MIDAEINDYLCATKGTRSAGERFNELLRRAMLAEQYQRLEVEAAAFFANAARDRSETRNLQEAAIRMLHRAASSRRS